MESDEILENKDGPSEDGETPDLKTPDDADEPYAEEEWIGEEWGDEDEIEVDVLEETDAPQYVDNGNQTVSDGRNRLMWKQTDSFKDFGYGINWFEAWDYCEDLNEKKFAGFDDWRLPGFDEAKGLFSVQKFNQDKDGAEIHIDPLFESGGGDNSWTYEEKPDYHQYAMKFSYITGNEKWEHKDNEYSYVRAVRDEVEVGEWEPEWRKDSKKLDG